MKRTDDYEAKLALWARAPRVHALPCAQGWPRFAPRKFDSYAAFNAWKQAYLDEVARKGGITWTK